MARLQSETLKDTGDKAFQSGGRAADESKDVIRAAPGVEAISGIAGDIIRRDKRGSVGDPFTQETWKLRFWEGFMSRAEILRDGG